MTTPLSVAVIIVNYRSAERTMEALDSLSEERARQPGELQLQVVVVENDSGDEAALREGIAGRFEDFVTLVVSPVNGGFGAGNNTGVRALREAGEDPDYVHFLNPDTMVRPGAVLELARFLRAHPEVGMCGSSFETETGRPWPYAFRFPSAWSELESGFRYGPVSRLLREHVVAIEMQDTPQRVDWLSGASVMMPLRAFEEVGGFDEGFFLYFEEVDLCRRLAARGFETWYVPASRVMHVCGHSTGVTNPDAAPKRLPGYWFESRRRYFLKHHGLPYSAAVDASFLLGNGVGVLKDWLKREPSTPYMSRDLLRSSAVWPGNRSPRAGRGPAGVLAGAKHLARLLRTVSDAR